MVVGQGGFGYVLFTSDYNRVHSITDEIKPFSTECAFCLHAHFRALSFILRAAISNVVDGLVTLGL